MMSFVEPSARLEPVVRRDRHPATIGEFVSEVFWSSVIPVLCRRSCQISGCS